MKRSIKAILCAIFSAAVLMLTACGADDSIRLGTGNNGGIYYRFGNLMNGFNNNIEVKETAGSQANLRLISQGFVDMAVVQSDVLSEAVSGTGDFKNQKITNVRAVQALYMESFQIIVSADSDIQSLADLKGKTVSLGEDGSGVAKNAEYVLNSVGVDIDTITVRELNYTRSAQALQDGTIDAFFAVVGAPSETITSLAEKMDIRLIPLDDRSVTYMTNLYQGYYKTSVKAGTYKGQQEDIQTIGVKAVLVADSKVSSKTVKNTVSLVYSKLSDIKKDIPFISDDKDFATSDIPCAFHEGAADYFSAYGITAETDASKSSEKFAFGAQDE